MSNVTPADLREACDAVEKRFAPPSQPNCPNASDPSFDVDYGTGHGHVCELCHGTGYFELLSHGMIRTMLPAMRALADQIESCENCAGRIMVWAENAGKFFKCGDCSGTGISSRSRALLESAAPFIEAAKALDGAQ